MSAVARLKDRRAGGPASGPLKALAATGQLGYGIPEATFLAGVARAPDFIGCDMGSIDPGPYYLGSGRMATSAAITMRDLRMVLGAARQLDVPLLIGTAGTAGAAPHLDQTLEMVRRIAREDGLRFRLAGIRADIDKTLVKAARAAGRLEPLGKIAPLDDAEIDRIEHLVGQMGTEAFCRALAGEADVIVAGRACDTAVFAAVPAMLGYPTGPAMHMAKIIECTSICCTPGGRDAMLATLEGDGFVLESMHPERHATPMSVAAHALYEQADPLVVIEPEGSLHLDDVNYQAVDDHRTRAAGARWRPAASPTVKIEGASRVGERAILLAGTSDPRFIAGTDRIFPEVERIVRDIVRATVAGEFTLYWRLYGVNGVVDWPNPAAPPREAFVLVECIAATAEAAETVIGVAKQYLLHHGFPGRLSTGGNIAFPFTPPEFATGTAYRFSAYHVMAVDALAPLFPVTFEEL